MKTNKIIKITEQTHKELTKIKMCPTETYDHIITRLIKTHKNINKRKK